MASLKGGHSCLLNLKHMFLGSYNVSYPDKVQFQGLMDKINGKNW